jgi:nucleotide-binding universal stress UspA family protein
MANDQRQSPWTQPTRILVAADGSESCADAVELAVEFGSNHEAELIFVHVVQPHDIAHSGALNDVGAAVPHEPTEREHAVLRDAMSVATERGVTASTVLLSGPTIEEIVAHADSVDADLIIVGTRGHGALAKALMGSVSLGILKHSTRPVLIVRGGNPGHNETDSKDAETTG